MDEKENILIPDGTLCGDNNKPNEEVVTWELRHYKEEIRGQDLKTRLGKRASLLKELQKHFCYYHDDIINFDIHVDQHHYVNDEEIWVESKHTLEISLSSITANLLAEIERILGEHWELQTDRYGIMRMKFNLSEGNLTVCED